MEYAEKLFITVEPVNNNSDVGYYKNLDYSKEKDY